MKRSIALLALSAALASFGAVADQSAGQPASSEATYEYGMPLDVAKVISVTQPATSPTARSVPHI